MALERCAVLRRAIFIETNQLPTCAREIKKLTDIQRFTDDIPEDALPSSGKKPATLTLQCAWAECDGCCSRPDRLKTQGVVTALISRLLLNLRGVENAAGWVGEFILIDRGDRRSLS